MAAAALLAAACAGTRGGAGGGDRPPERPPEAAEAGAEIGAPAVRPSDALARLDSLSASADPERTVRAADSLFFRWRGEPTLRDAAARALRIEVRALVASGRLPVAADRLEELLAAAEDEERVRGAAAELAGLRIRLGREPSALRALERWPGALPDSLLSRVREAAAGMSVTELDGAADLFAAGSRERGAVAAERARALALTGRADSARAVAERALEGALSEADRETVRAVLGGELGPDDRGAFRIGLVLPLTGDLESVGQLLREASAVAAGADSVRLVVRDDSSRAGTVPAIVEELERSGVAAIVGPITSGGFAAALEARSDLSLPVISPAASEVRRPGPNAYSLWARAQRVRDLSRALGAWVPERTGLRKLALLRAESGAGRTYEHGFRSGARRGGGWVAAAGTYEPDSTTFSGPVRWLAANRPESLLVGSGDTRTVLQMAPQLSYYGLRDALVAGGSAWGQPVAVRRLSEGFPSRWITAVFADRTADGTAWAAFRSAYERRYRKGLPARRLPALGHDAVAWAAASMGAGRLPRRGVVARGMSRGTFDGASGSFSARTQASTVDREVRVRMAAGGELRAPDSAALHEWRRQAGRLVDAGRRRRREEARTEVRRWMERHGDSVRVDSARIRDREERLPGADSLPEAAGDTAAAGTGERREAPSGLREEGDEQ